ncbi:hypothetical protein ACVRWB_09625 [Streptococcus troglodytae]|uniref:hypothetical protein n=1 Tax=Streptococcus troglodytae TaxID=1111760 RepID=UPI0012B64460|nr:hypothetical protein [Streptococcus troglodytae]
MTKIIPRNLGVPETVSETGVDSYDQSVTLPVSAPKINLNSICLFNLILNCYNGE